MAKLRQRFAVVQGTPDESPAGQVRKRVRKSARDWPACPHCGGRSHLTERTGNITNKICSTCAIVDRRRVVIG